MIDVLSGIHGALGMGGPMHGLARGARSQPGPIQGNRGVPAPAFWAELIDTLVPRKATGSATPTFTRATTAAFEDWEGVLRTAISGEPRFVGARRVYNEIQSSENIVSGTGWSDIVAGTGVVPVVTANYEAAPDGTITATRVQLDRGASNTTGDYSVRRSVAVVTTFRNTAKSVWIKSNTGVNQVISLNGGSITSNITVTPTWRRMAVIITDASLTATFDIGTRGTYGTDRVVDVSVWHPQIETITGQSVTAPSEYVSTGVLSAPYHGAGVDGVKYFRYQNGNTVASNVVTEAQGAAIADATLDGYLAEGARTNYYTASDDSSAEKSSFSFDTHTANSVAGPTGAVNADKIEFNANGYCYWVAVNETGNNVASIYLRSDAPVQIGIRLYRTVASEDVVALVNVTTAWSRFELTRSFSGVSTAGIGLDTRNGVTGDDGAAKTVYVGGRQLELGTFASAYIPTTTVAVTRNASVDSNVSAGNIAAAAGTIALKFTPTHSPSGTIALWGTYVDANNYTAILHDATNIIFRKRIGGVNYDATKALAFVAETTYRIAARWGASGVSVFVDGVKGTDDANATAAQIGTNFQTGADGNSLQQPFAEIGDERCWTTALTDQQIAGL